MAGFLRGDTPPNRDPSEKIVPLGLQEFQPWLVVVSEWLPMRCQHANVTHVRSTMVEVSVRSERIRTLYRQTTPVLITNCLNSIIVGAALWGSAPRSLLSVWVIAMCAVALARAGLARAYAQSGRLPANAEYWGTRFAIGSAAAGLLWGSAGYVLLANANSLSQLLVTFMIGGMCAAAAGTTASYLPAFLAFSLPALIALSARMIQFGDSIHVVMAVVLVIYAVALCAVARMNGRVLTEAFTLRFENERLIGELTTAHAQLEESNRNLEQRVSERAEILRVQSETLRNAQRMESVGRLAGGVAHDFNNLLTIILANLSDINPSRDSAARTTSALSEVREAATKGADLVRQLLMFSRQQRTLPEILDLNTVVRAMDRSLRDLLGGRRRLVLDLHNSPVLVRADPTQIEQVLLNLVSNARDATTNEGVIRVETCTLDLTEPTEVLEAGPFAMLAISDTGTGMDTDTQQLIFDPFYTTKEVGKGTGLGLATVYGIVQSCAGEIRVDSQVNRGSTFRIYLPLGRASMVKPDGESRSLALAQAPSQPPMEETAITLLLVEDEPMVRNVTRRILSREGFRVLTAESAERALAVSARHAGVIDLLITDVIMAGMSGPQLAQQLHESRPRIRTLFMSGYSRDQLIPSDDLASGKLFLAKPFTKESLLTKVTELLAEATRNVHTPAA
jgi:two-component system, cell cycle sensor histidine kinase and response regulator CckA